MCSKLWGNELHRVLNHELIHGFIDPGGAALNKSYFVSLILKASFCEPYVEGPKSPITADRSMSQKKCEACRYAGFCARNKIRESHHA